MADDDDLYGDLDDTMPRLASTTGLTAELTTVRTERVALESRLQTLRTEGAASREAIQDLTRRACVLLATARHELQRKDEQLAACKAEAAEIRHRRTKAPKSKRPPAGQRDRTAAAERMEPAPSSTRRASPSDDDDDEAADRDPKRLRR